MAVQSTAIDRAAQDALMVVDDRGQESGDHAHETACIISDMGKWLIGRLTHRHCRRR
jgi:hypothetical protein